METNIILVGMPGCGKTSIGNLLLKKLANYTLYDTDSIIEKTQGLSIADIFKKHTEDYFRKIEYDTIKLVCSGGKGKIISIGGGAFENPDTRASLLKYGKVFYLKTDLDVLYFRIKQNNVRPLLQTDDKKTALENIFKKREENFLKAHYVIDTNNLSEDKIVNLILDYINEKNS